MRAVKCNGAGGVEVLELVEGPDPVPRPGEVLIDIAASSVNRADVLQRQGGYAPPPGASDVLGLECSGVISAVGEGVEGWQVGDQVAALLVAGGYAEKVTVPAGQILPVPTSIDPVTDVSDLSPLIVAGGLPEVVCTVWSNVFMAAALRAGETFLVHGGTSGIGTTAIQLAKAMGARVFATAGTPEKVARCRELGADVAVSYREEDFVEVVRRETGGDGVHVILDNMGAQYLDRNVNALAVDGRLVVIGLQGGAEAELNIATLLVKRASVMATSLRARSVGEKAGIVASVKENVWPLIEDGRLRPVVQAAVPLDDVQEAHRLLEAGGHVGKILLTM